MVVDDGQDACFLGYLKIKNLNQKMRAMPKMPIVEEELIKAEYKKTAN